MALLVLFLFVATAGAQEPIKPAKTIRLFDGRSLDGWYTWLRDSAYQDPDKVFRVEQGMLRITGTHWGGIATKQSYRDYRLVVEWKWGGPTLGDRATKARDSGILVHAVGEDGAYNKTWLESIESQIIEGGTGDFIMVGGKNKPTMTCDVRVGENNQVYWQEGGTPTTKSSGRFNWYGRDPAWRDEVGFRGSKDLDKPVGEWNRQEVIAEGDRITNIINGTVVNRGYNSSHTAGKIQIQSEGAEIWIRKVELQPLRK